MPASEQSNGHAHLTEAEEGVLSKLPRTRPQRTTRRRLAAREASAAGDTLQTPRHSAPAKASTATGAATAPASERAQPAANSRTREGAGARGKERAKGGARAAERANPRRQRSRAGAPRRAPTSHEPAPRQGFESEGERSSAAVQPPGGAEIMASAAEMVGEVAKAGLAAGERLLKDVFARLPLS